MLHSTVLTQQHDVARSSCCCLRSRMKEFHAFWIFMSILVALFGALCFNISSFCRLLVFSILVSLVLSSVASQPQEGSSRSRTRGLIPPLNFRAGASRRLSNSKKGIQNIPNESNKTVSDEPRELAELQPSNEPSVITEPRPGQEFVSFVKGSVHSQQKPRNEILLITDPIPGQEFVSFSSQPEQAQDSVVSAKDGKLFYINLNEASTPTNQDTTYDPFSTTPSPNYNDEYLSTSLFDDVTTQSPSPNEYLPNKNIEILTPNANLDVKGTAVNELYGKYFDESDLLSNDEKELFPAESKVRSKFEIKEVNGQLYEYEYRYYYDDELPEYDYDVVGNIPDISTTQSADATEAPSTSTFAPPTTTTSTTSAPTTPPPTTTPLATRTRSSSRGSSTFTRSRSRDTIAREPQIHENIIIPQSQGSRGRSRGQSLSRLPASVPDRTVPLRTSSRGISHTDDTINSVGVGTGRLPTHTRFPPRVTTSAPEPESFGVPLSDASYLPTAKSPKEDMQEITSTLQPFEDQSTTLSPATRSLMNLYALSQAAEAEETEISTVQPDLFNQGTNSPFDYLDAYYDYDYDSSSSSFSPLGVSDSTLSPEYIDSSSTEPSTTPTTTTTTTTSTTTTTTPEPTTTTTTAPSTRSRSRGSFRNPLSSGRRRFSSRTSSQTASEATTPEVATEAAVRKGSNRLQSLGAQPSRDRFRPSNNRFRSSSSRFRPSRNEETTSITEDSLGTTESTKVSLESTTARAASRNRFSRPRPSFRSRSRSNPRSDTSESSTTSKPSTTSSSASGRGRLFNRFSRRRQSSRTQVETSSAEPDSEISISSSDAASSDIKEESAVTPSSTSATSAITRPSRNRSLARRRFGRPSRFGVQTEASAKTDTADSPATGEEEVQQEDVVEQEVTSEAPQTKTTKSLRRPSRVRSPPRISSLRNSRGRGRGRNTASTTIPTPQVEEESASETESETEPSPLEGDTSVDEAAEEKKSPQNNNQGRRRGSIFNRFRNRGTANKAASATTKAATTTSAPKVRSRFSLLGNRRMRPNRRNRGEEELTNEEETAAPEPTPIEEPLGNDLDAHGPQVELEAQASGQKKLDTYF